MAMKKRFPLSKLIVQIIIVILFSSCYNYRNTGLLQEKRIFLPEYEKGEYVDYRIRVNDELVFRILTSDATYSSMYSSNASNVNNMLSYRVATDGTVDLPFVQKIRIEGLTLEEAEDVVEERFKESIPDAAIRLVLNNKSFTVVGEVGTGVFPVYKERLNIYQALALAGDLQQSGDRKHIKIIREMDNGTKTLEFDIRPQSIIESEYYYVYPNDIIYVRKLPSSFYKISNYSGFIGLINTTVTFFSTVLIYAKITE